MQRQLTTVINIEDTEVDVMIEYYYDGFAEDSVVELQDLWFTDGKLVYNEYKNMKFLISSIESKLLGLVNEYIEEEE